MWDTNNSKQKQPWKRFFVITGSSAGALTLLSILGTIILQLSIPPDCSSCGMAVVGLAPLYLLALVALITLWVGSAIWSTRRAQASWKKAAIVIVAALPLVAYAIRLIVTF